MSPWEAHYQDGEVLKEDTHKFREIDQSKLATFRIVDADNPDRSFILQWKEGRKLIHFWRNLIVYANDHNKGPIHLTLTCFGYEEKGIKNLFVVMPDGGLIITDDIDSIKVEI
jgi:hypothetical protein